VNEINAKPTGFRRKIFFFLSILCSISINLLVLFFLNLYHLPNSPLQKDNKKTLIVKINDLSRFITKKAEGFFYKWKGRKMALSDLAINTSTINFRPVPLINKEGIGHFGDNTGFDNLSVDGHNSIYHYINKTIKRHIDYPQAFVDRGIEGVIQGRLVFSPKGIYLPKLSKLRGSNGRLKVHVAKTLQELFKNPLPYNLNFVRHDFFMVDTTIRFVIRPYRSKKFHQMNSFSNGRHMAILIEKRGFNPHYKGNQWMDLLVTLMQYAPVAKGQPINTEGALVPLLQGFISDEGPIKLKDGTLQVNTSTKDFLIFLQKLFIKRGMIDTRQVRETYNKNQQELSKIRSDKPKMKYEDYKEDPEWDEWARQR